jgi:hypothetical protein
MPAENNWNRKLRFMELMQRCLPFKWQKYWNCSTKEFDLLRILQEIDDLNLSVQDRLLLTLLARIWTGKQDSIDEIKKALRVLEIEEREILADWMQEQLNCEIRFAHGADCRCPCCTTQATHR